MPASACGKIHRRLRRAVGRRHRIVAGQLEAIGGGWPSADRPWPDRAVQHIVRAALPDRQVLDPCLVLAGRDRRRKVDLAFEVVLAIDRECRAADAPPSATAWMAGPALPSSPLRLIANGPSISTAAGSTATAAASAAVRDRSAPISGSAGADTVVPSFSPVIRFEAASRDALPSIATVRPSTTRSAENCMPPSSDCESSACAIRNPSIPVPSGRTTSTLSSSIERVEPTSNCVEQPVRRVENGHAKPVRIDQPVGVLERRRPVGRRRPSRMPRQRCGHR